MPEPKSLGSCPYPTWLTSLMNEPIIIHVLFHQSLEFDDKHYIAELQIHSFESKIPDECFHMKLKNVIINNNAQYSAIQYLMPSTFG